MDESFGYDIFFEIIITKVLFAAKHRSKINSKCHKLKFLFHPFVLNFAEHSM